MTRLLVSLLFAGCLSAQTPEVPDATRILQLMESTAVAKPGLIQASDLLRQSAVQTANSLARTPRNPALLYRFIGQIKAYLALSETIPRPNPFPAAADQQYAELREDLAQLERAFEAVLDNSNLDAKLKASDPNDLRHYAEANSKLSAPAAMPRVVFLGDGATEVWRLNEYFTGRDFINRGISGQTTLQMLGRFHRDVEALQPRLVVILAGSEDIAAGVDTKQIEDNLTTLAELSKAAGIKAVFGSILSASGASINRWLDDYCRNPASSCSFLNYQPVLADFSSLSDDGLIPNSKGLRAMSPLALDAIDRALASATPASPPDAQKKRRGLFQK